MSSILQGEDDKTYDKLFGFIRFILLILFLMAILNNRNDQTNDILSVFPEIQSSSTFLTQIKKSFSAANTLSMMFVIMQFIVLYVGTNRFRFWHSIVVFIVHAIGIFVYISSSRWLFQNIWINAFLFCALPTFTEIGVALYTARA